MAQAGDAIRVFRDPTAEFGTLGCVLAFQDDDDPRRFLLTCSHVLAPPGFPTPGPDVYDNFGTTIARTIGTSEIVREHIDVALAELLVPCNPAIRTVGMPVGWATQIASGDTLRGCGARSGIVLGTQIISPNQSATIEVLDSSRNPISLRLNDHIIANNVGFLPGDSGCALVDDFHFVVGLFVGFAQDKTVVIAPIRAILEWVQRWVHKPLKVVNDPSPLLIPITDPQTNVVQPNIPVAPANTCEKRSWRNCNPGNLGTIPPPGWLNQSGADGRYSIFPAPEWGWRAFAINMLTYFDTYKLNTVRGITYRWAPPKENDTEAYINFVCGETKFGPDEVINIKDVDVLQKLGRAISRQEGCCKDVTGRLMDWPEDAMLRGFGLALKLDDIEPEQDMAPAFDADASKVHPIQHPTVDGPIPSNTDFTEFARARVPGLRHFQPAEFLIKGSTNALMHSNTDPPRDLWPNIIKIIQVMDEFRSRIGSPVVLNSVYRSEAYNRAVGGVSDSQHTKFRAADFRVIDGMSLSSWAGLLRQMREEGVFQGGIGVYSTFVHVDTRGLNANW